MTDRDRAQQAESFTKNYIPKSKTAGPGGKIGFSFGNTYKFGEQKALGLLFSVLFKESSETISGASEIRYQTSNDKSTDITYDKSTYSTTTSAQLSTSYSLSRKNKIKYNGFYTHQSGNSAKIKKGQISIGAGTGKQYITSYVETDLIFNQLMGEHIFDTMTKNNAIKWKASYAITRRKQPDVSSIFYDSNGLVDSTNPMSKYFNSHYESTYQLSPEYVFRFRQWDGLFSKLILGCDFNIKTRTNEGRRFFIKFQDSLNVNNPDADPDTIFQSNDMFVNEVTGDTLATGLDSYNAGTNIYAGYGLLDLLITRKLRLITGVRYERWQQQVSAYSILNSDKKYTTAISGVEILPSFNFVYTISKDLNLRFAFSQTINRPEYVEMGNYNYYDQLETGFIIKGNPGLEKSSINNFDIRFEFYPKINEILALSLFYKDIDKPIESTVGIADDPTFTFANQKKAEIFGIELEVKTNFKFISETLKNLSLLFNLTGSMSEIELDESLGSAETNSKRPLQGQSPVILNLGINYVLELTETDFTLLYNMFSRRIVYVGINGLPNTYEEPFHQLDLTISQKISNYGRLKLAVENILNDEIRQNQGSGNDKKLTLKYSKGINVSFGYSYNFK